MFLQPPSKSVKSSVFKTIICACLDIIRQWHRYSFYSIFILFCVLYIKFRNFHDPETVLLNSFLQIADRDSKQHSYITVPETTYFRIRQKTFKTKMLLNLKIYRHCKVTRIGLFFSSLYNFPVDIRTLYDILYTPVMPHGLTLFFKYVVFKTDSAWWSVEKNRSGMFF